MVLASPLCQMIVACIFMTKKINMRSDVDGLTHTKQLLNIVCIVYFEESNYLYSKGLRVESTKTVSTHKICIHIIQIVFF